MGNKWVLLKEESCIRPGTCQALQAEELGLCVEGVKAGKHLTVTCLAEWWANSGEYNILIHHHLQEGLVLD